MIDRVVLLNNPGEDLDGSVDRGAPTVAVLPVAIAALLHDREEFAPGLTEGRGEQRQADDPKQQQLPGPHEPLPHSVQRLQGNAPPSPNGGQLVVRISCSPTSTACRRRNSYWKAGGECGIRTRGGGFAARSLPLTLVH